MNIDVLKLRMAPSPEINAAIFNTMRILKGINKGDTYLENYQWHNNKRGDKFLDYYHLLWTIGAVYNPKRIMEIGCRTGISICQLLSACKDYTAYADVDFKKVVLFDMFADGLISPGLIKRNLKHLNIPVEPEFIIGDSKVTVPQYTSGTFEYILVDGDHSKEGAMIDLTNVIPLLETGGILIFDDISEDGVSLDDVWQNFKSQHQDEFQFAEDYNGKGFGIGVKVV
jgi:predicted O-methyltransferase YrrM